MTDVKDIIPTFFVADVGRSVEWYVRVLGFKAAFVHGEPPQYAGVVLGPARIHLAGVEDRPPGVSFKGACYLRLQSGVDAYVAEVVARGQGLVATLKDHPYGMREATVRDPDGNDLYIGQALR